MKKIKLIGIFFLMTFSFISFGQDRKNEESKQSEIKVIAVVNRANWCSVCKANGERFSQNILPYTTKGLMIVINDLTDETTIAKSKTELENSDLYQGKSI